MQMNKDQDKKKTKKQNIHLSEGWYQFTRSKMNHTLGKTNVHWSKFLQQHFTIRSSKYIVRLVTAFPLHNTTPINYLNTIYKAQYEKLI